MDFSDPQIWKEGTDIVVHNLHIVAPLVAATAVAAWWLRGVRVNNTIDGLREQIEARKVQIEAPEAENTRLRQQLQQADDSGRVVSNWRIICGR